MTSSIIYQGGLHCELLHLRSGNKIETDAPVDNNGKGEAFSPTDLTATSLGACMLTIMGIKARDLDLDIEGTSCKINKIMESNPRRIAAIELLIEMPANNFSAEEKATLERVAKACPVAKSLHPDIKQKFEFVWLEK